MLNPCKADLARAPGSRGRAASALPRAVLSFLFLLLPLVAPACAEGDQGRAGWLHSTLVEDNLVWLEREPELVALKFKLMAGSPYAWFRGTAGQFLRDQRDPRGVGSVTRFGADRAAFTLTVGDPHPENLGTFLGGDGVIFIDFNDFDAADYRPFVLDVRRLALGFATVAVHARGQAFDGLDEDRLAAAAARGYATEIESIAAGRRGPAFAEGDAGDVVILADLIRRARRDGDIREELSEYTAVDVTGTRTMVFGEVEPREAGFPVDEVWPVSPADEDLARRLVATLPGTLAAEPPTGAEAVLGVSRRLGAGVSSYPNPRWYVAVEGETPDLADDVLLELKEISPAPGGPNPYLAIPRQFGSDAERVIALQRALQGRDDADRWLGWSTDGMRSFRVRERTKYQRGADLARIIEKLQSGEWTATDVEAFADAAGALLARAHTNAPNAVGGDALPAIVEALQGDQDGFVAETVAFATAYLEQSEADRRAFSDLLETNGPWLGHVPRSQP